MDASTDKETDRGWTHFIPLGLLAVAFLAWTIFQTVVIYREATSLRAMKANQEPTIGQATKVRGQADSIAGKLAELAAKGNPGAKMIVDELRRRGVTISPGANKPEEKPIK